MIWHLAYGYAHIPAYFSLQGSNLSVEQTTALLSIAGLAICLATLVNTDFGLSVLVFSMLLSPEIEIPSSPSGRSVFVWRIF